MDIFLSIFFKILPLYIFVIIGFVAGKYLDIDIRGIGKLLIYIIIPFVIFEAITHSNLSINTFILPVISFAICFFVAFLFYKLGNYIYDDSPHHWNHKDSIVPRISL